VSGLGKAIRSGLTDRKLDVFADAFLPGRNLYFLLIGASVAIQEMADAIAIGLLTERKAQFPDQSKKFLRLAEGMLGVTMGRSIKVVAPLMDLDKREVVVLGRAMRIAGTYSCHAGTPKPCGKCIACREYM
jgi:7-cyano-7-deazaguanine synthase